MFLRLENGYSLVMCSQENPDSAKVRPPAHFIVMIDRSGSMTSSIRQLVRDIKDQVSLIPEGDFLSLAWFSSEGGEYGFPLKGFRVTAEDKKDDSRLMQILDKQASTVGLTCFSEVLVECEKVIEETDVSPVVALWMMTDGQPVVINRQREIKTIRESLIRLSKKLTSANFVGYSDFYNKELMAEMAELAGGTLRHASNIGNLSAQLREFIEETDRSGRLMVNVPKGTRLSFTTSMATYLPQDDWKVYVTPMPGEYTRVFSLVEDYEPSNKEREVNPEAFYADCLGDVNSFMEGCYAATAILCSKVATLDLATSIMAKVGDKRFIDRVASAFTVEERGLMAELAKSAITTKKERFVEGQVGQNYLPAPDAFCVLELLELLTNDDNARFFPTHKDFKYKRTSGAKTTIPEGYPKFEPDPDGCRMTGMNWHSERLNLSLQLNLAGTIDLGESAEANDLPQMFPTYEWKQYTIIKDGALWTQRIPVKMSQSVKNQIIDRLDDPTVLIKDPEDSEITIIDLTKLPLINKNIAASAAEVGPTKMAEFAVTESTFLAEIKVCKAKLAELGQSSSATSGESLASKYDANQLAFLESKGIKIQTGAYAPPRTREEVEDYYLTTGLQLKIKGWSSLPTVEKVVTHPENKKMNGPTAAMYREVQRLENLIFSAKTNEKRVELLNKHLISLKAQLAAVRKNLQELKFSIILGRKWFWEDESSHTVTVENGSKELVQVTFELNDQIKVKA